MPKTLLTVKILSLSSLIESLSQCCLLGRKADGLRGELAKVIILQFLLVQEDSLTAATETMNQDSAVSQA